LGLWRGKVHGKAERPCRICLTPPCYECVSVPFKRCSTPHCHSLICKGEFHSRRVMAHGWWQCVLCYARPIEAELAVLPPESSSAAPAAGAHARDELRSCSLKRLHMFLCPCQRFSAVSPAFSEIAACPWLWGRGAC
jgi:hypothetical protein